MKQRIAVQALDEEFGGEDRREAPVDSPAAPAPVSRKIGGVTVGILVAFKEHGAIPLVTHGSQAGTAARTARTLLDLHASHIGREVALLFEDGDPERPIVIGCFLDQHAASPELASHVEVDVDGQRLTVTARDQMVLRCGKASITLTRAGKILVQGTYVSNRSSGVLRIKGGSVQIN
jgi:hypothetical protein